MYEYAGIEKTLKTGRDQSLHLRMPFWRRSPDLCLPLLNYQFNSFKIYFTLHFDKLNGHPFNNNALFAESHKCKDSSYYFSTFSNVKSLVRRPAPEENMS